MNIHCLYNHFNIVLSLLIPSVHRFKVFMASESLYVICDALEKVRLKSHDLVVVNHVTATAGSLQSGPLTSHSQLLHSHVRLRIQLSVFLRQRTCVHHLHWMR